MDVPFTHSAASVASYLAEAKVDPSTLSTTGFGEARPVDSNDSPEGRQRNRRVEIVVQSVNEDLLTGEAERIEP